MNLSISPSQESFSELNFCFGHYEIDGNLFTGSFSLDVSYVTYAFYSQKSKETRLEGSVCFFIEGMFCIIANKRN